MHDGTFICLLLKLFRRVKMPDVIVAVKVEFGTPLQGCWRHVDRNLLPTARKGRRGVFACANTYTR
jgi:hypothetical protein